MAVIFALISAFLLFGMGAKKADADRNLSLSGLSCLIANYYQGVAQEIMGEAFWNDWVPPWDAYDYYDRAADQAYDAWYYATLSYDIYASDAADWAWEAYLDLDDATDYAYDAWYFDDYWDAYDAVWYGGEAAQDLTLSAYYSLYDYIE